MLIIHKLDDLGFKADSLEDLKRQVEDFYSVNGYKPEARIEGDTVVVSVDTDLVNRASELKERVITLCNQGELDKAMTVLEEAQGLMPCCGDIYRLKAQIYYIRDHNASLAMDTCIDALRYNPQDYYALELMGNILMSENDANGALSYYKKVLEYNPDDIVAIGNIANIEAQNGNYDKAVSMFTRLIDKGDATPTIYYGLAVTYVLMGKPREAFDIGIRGLKETEDRPENPGVKDKLCQLTLQSASEIVKSVNTQHVVDGVREEIESQLSLPLEVRFNNDMAVYGRVEYGPAYKRNHHVLYYKENSTPPLALHTILHELTHLEMSNSASKLNKNLIMYSSDKQYEEFRRRHNPFVRDMRSRLGATANQEIYRLFKMFGMLLMNTPLDLFVEQRIYDKYSTLRPFQFLSLYRQSGEYLRSVIDPKIKQTFPEPIIRIAKICNMVTAMHVNHLYGIDTVAQYKPTDKELNQAKDLYEEFLAYKDYTPGEEYDYMDYFIQSLGVEDYFVRTNENEFLDSQLKGIRDKIGEDDEVKKANEQFAKKHPDNESSVETLMMSFYMLDALQYFDKLSLDEIKKIAQEIAILGLKGIDPNVKDYKVPSIDKTFGGYQLLAYYYVSWVIVYPERIDALGLPFSKAYELALKMYKGGSDNNK